MPWPMQEAFLGRHDVEQRKGVELPGPLRSGDASISLIRRHRPGWRHPNQRGAAGECELSDLTFHISGWLLLNSDCPVPIC